MCRNSPIRPHLSQASSYDCTLPTVPHKRHAVTSYPRRRRYTCPLFLRNTSSHRKAKHWPKSGSSEPGIPQSPKSLGGNLSYCPPHLFRAPPMPPIHHPPFASPPLSLPLTPVTPPKEPGISRLHCLGPSSPHTLPTPACLDTRHPSARNRRPHIHDSCQWIPTPQALHTSGRILDRRYTPRTVPSTLPPSPTPTRPKPQQSWPMPPSSPPHRSDDRQAGYLVTRSPPPVQNSDPRDNERCT